MELVDRIREVCRTHLSGSWAASRDDQIVVEAMGKGCSNKILTASLQLKSGVETDKVLVRIYGDILSNQENLIRDVVLNSYLGHTGKAPTIRGLFREGRLEEFVPCSVISRENFALEYKKIAKLMSNIHDIQCMPFAKTPTFEINIRNYISKLAPAHSIYWTIEANWLLNIITSLPLEVCLCHNDINMNNVIVRDGSKDDPILIDYEFSQYNYALFDIGNYYCERQFDWLFDEKPFYKREEAWFPTEEEMLTFIKEYISTRASTAQLQSPETLLKQVKVMILASHMLWCLWGLTVSGENIDNKEYSDCRKNLYKTDKLKYLEDINQMMHDINTEKMIGEGKGESHSASR